MPEIKKCPFCGNKADYWEDSQYQDRHVIECMNCGANKRSEYGYKSVLRDWNTRYDNNGIEIIDIPVAHYRPTLTARVGYKANGDYNDVRVWIGDVAGTVDEAIAAAEVMAKEVEIMPGAHMSTETT